MTSKEKWVELFEKVVGRRPTPQEFLQGKATDFDLKQIRAIAGLGALTSQEEEGRQEAVVASPIHPQVEEASQSIQEEQPMITAPQVPVNKPVKKLSKRAKIIILTVALVLLSLVTAGFFYLKSQTGLAYTSHQFIQAVENNDADQVAQLLGTSSDKWSKEDAKEFITYLKKENIQLSEEFDKIVESKGDHTIKNKYGNQLLSLKEAGKKYGLFTDYRVYAHPIEVVAKTDLDGVKVNGKEIESGKEVLIGRYHFIKEDFEIEVESDIGEEEFDYGMDLDDVRHNKFSINLESIIVRIQAKLPDIFSEVSNVHLFVNGKEVAQKLSTILTVLSSLDVNEVKARFTYKGQEFTTESKEPDLITISGGGDKFEVNLRLSEADMKKAQALNGQGKPKTKTAPAIWNAQKSSQLKDYILKTWGPELHQVYEEATPYKSINYFGVNVPNDILNEKAMTADFNGLKPKLVWTQTGAVKQGEYALVAVYSDVKDATSNGKVSGHLYFFTIKDGKAQVWITEQNQGNLENKLYFRETANEDLKNFFVKLVESK